MGKSLKSFLIIVAIVIVAMLGIYFTKSKTDPVDNPENNDNNIVGEAPQAQTATSAYNAPEIPLEPLETDIIFFYGTTCPHCKKVEQFFADTEMDKRVVFEQREVYENRSNSEIMTEKQELCKDLSEDDKNGVPFMYSSQTCVVGDQPIINYFMALTGIVKK